MSLLDISGSGLFGNSSQFMHVLGIIAKLAGGSFLILLFAVLALIGVTIYALVKGYQISSITGGARIFVQSVSYIIGISIAMLFMLVAGLFFSIAALKLFFIAALIAFSVAFVVRETFIFMVLKRFGKYVMYFTALQFIKEKVYANGQQQNFYENNS